MPSLVGSEMCIRDRASTHPELSSSCSVKAPKFSHTTPILKSLYWLKVNERIEYKILSHIQDSLHRSIPTDLHNLIYVQSHSFVISHHHRSSTLIFISQKSQIALSVMHHRHPVFGIIFLLHSVNLVHHLSPQSLPLSSILDLKLTCSTNPSQHRS